MRTRLIAYRNEIEQLKHDLEKQFANDRASTIKHLNDKKNEQIQQLSEESDAKIYHLMQQVFMRQQGRVFYLAPNPRVICGNSVESWRWLPLYVLPYIVGKGLVTVGF